MNEQPKIKIPEPKESLGIKILLADDEIPIRTITTRILRNMGYTVEEVESGEQLLEKLRTAKPGEYNMVITDKEMLGMDGMQVLEEIRADIKLRDLPVMMYSGDADETGNRKIVEVQNGVYLAKPFYAAQLDAAVRKTLSKSPKETKPESTF